VGEENEEGRWKAVRAHSDDRALAEDGVVRKRDVVGYPEEELEEDFLLQGEVGLCRIDALGVRS
jgi:hypothetical protein